MYNKVHGMISFKNLTYQKKDEDYSYLGYNNLTF